MAKMCKSQIDVKYTHRKSENKNQLEKWKQDVHIYRQTFLTKRYKKTVQIEITKS